MHVFNTLFRMEQKRNTELSAKLKCSLEDNNATKSSCEGLTTSLISLKADKALLEQQLHIKDQEYQSLNALLNQAKADLLKAMGAQREVQADLSIEQHKVQVLENQKNELINEVSLAMCMFVCMCVCIDVKPLYGRFLIFLNRKDIRIKW